MHYTSWGKRERHEGRQRIPLLIEDGPEELGVFAEDTAAVGGGIWQLSRGKEGGARATLDDGRVFEAAGNLARDKRIEVSLAGRRFTFVNEARNDWIIDDADSLKIGQFSGGNNGVRRAILEFEEEASADLSDAERAGLSWFVRLILESRLGGSSWALLGTLAGFTIVGLLAFVFK